METIKISILLSFPQGNIGNITKNYKIIYSEDGKIKAWDPEIKTKILKYLKLNFKNPDFYSITTNFYKECPDFLISNDNDFEFLLKDYVDFELSQEKSKETLTFSITENKKTVKKRQHIIYNKNGSVDKEKTSEEIIIDRPSDEIFENDCIEVSCAFCNETNFNKNYIELLGPLYGPYAIKKKKVVKNYFVHEACGLWSPEVYLNSKNSRFENLEKEIKRGKKSYCSFCKQKGATLGCNEKKCKTNYHVKCLWEFEEIQGEIDNVAYLFFCESHMKKREKQEEKYDYLLCKKCGLGTDDAHLLLCDICDEGYHTYCLENELIEIPEEDWFCEECNKKAK